MVELRLNTNKIIIRQGDQMAYPLPLYLGYSLLRKQDVEEIEVSIGTFIHKTLSEGDIVFDDINNYFELWLTQDDTFNLLPSKGRFGYYEYPTQVRVVLRKNEGYHENIYSFPGPNVEVIESLSKERL